MNRLLLAKLAGERKALSDFGCTHGTPKPPPAFSQAWQGREVPRVQKHVTIPSMREEPLR